VAHLQFGATLYNVECKSRPRRKISSAPRRVANHGVDEMHFSGWW